MKLYFMVTASLLALVVSAPVVAQTADSSATGAMGDDIVVTARRVEERLQDVPIAVTAVQGERLSQLGIQQPVDLKTAVAGLNVTSSAGSHETALYMIRGMLGSDQVYTQDPPVAVYLDEILVTPVAGSNLGLFDLENVQVLKGPQGTLFGRNTTGGAVLYTSARPTDEFSGKVTVGYANFDSWKANGYINLPIGEGLKVRAAVDYKKQGGFGEMRAGPELGAEVGGYRQLGGRFSVLAEPTDNLKILTIASYTDYTSEAGPNSDIFSTPSPSGFANLVFGTALAAALAQQRADNLYDTRSGNLQGAGVKVLSVTNTTTLDLSDTLTLKNIFGYRKLKWWEARDIDGTALPILEASQGARASTFSDELQLQGTAFDDKLNFIFGGYFFDQRGSEGTGLPYMNSKNQLVGTVAFGAAPNMQINRITNQSFSGFGQFGYKLTDTLTFNAGLRYTVDQRRNVSSAGKVKPDPVTGFATPTSCLYVDTTKVIGTDASGNPMFAPLPATFAGCRVTGEKSFAEPSWLVGLDWKPDPDTLIYLAHRHSFRSGGFQSRAATTDQAQLAFAPEIVNDLELGFKREWALGADLGLRTNVAAFYTWYSNIQRNVTTATSLGVGNLTRNAAKAHINGLELETELRIGRIARLAVNYAYTNAVYDSFPTVAPVGGVLVPIDRSGARFQAVPKHQLNGSITVTPDIGEIGELLLLANVYYRSTVALSETYDSRESLAQVVPATFVIPADALFEGRSYAYVNARAELNNISGSGISVALWGKNLFDKHYIDTGLLFQNAIGIDTVTFGDPRTYGIEVSFKF